MGADNISYEDARAELRRIVSALESGGQPLEESLALWQRGEELARICNTWLDAARTQLEAALSAVATPEERETAEPDSES